MIKTKCLYYPKDISDGERILITRYWPRGIKKEHFDRWDKELSPSRNLLKNIRIIKSIFKHLKDYSLRKLKNLTLLTSLKRS